MAPQPEQSVVWTVYLPGVCLGSFRITVRRIIRNVNLSDDHYCFRKVINSARRDYQCSPPTSFQFEHTQPRPKCVRCPGKDCDRSIALSLLPGQQFCDV
ncbi:hypothetical protein BD309DRAFT_969575, partial [Dichomitus squalens]